MLLATGLKNGTLIFWTVDAVTRMFVQVYTLDAFTRHDWVKMIEFSDWLIEEDGRITCRLATTSSCGEAIIWTIDRNTWAAEKTSVIQEAGVGIQFQCVSFYQSMLPQDNKILCVFGRYCTILTTKEPGASLFGMGQTEKIEPVNAVFPVRFLASQELSGDSSAMDSESILYLAVCFPYASKNESLYSSKI
jgi:hypothetical protein